MSVVLSVAVPAHGRVALLNETLESLQRQTLRGFEVVVSDDSTSEGERADIQRLVGEHQDAGLLARYVFTGPRLGQAGNTNQAIRHCRGKYIRILHSDDLLSRDALEKEVAFLESSPDVQVMYHHPLHFEDGRDPKFSVRGPDSYLVSADTWLSGPIVLGTVLPSCLVFRRDVINRTGGMDEAYDFVCDWDFFFRLVVDSHRLRSPLGVFDPGLVAWRVHQQSVTGTRYMTHFREHEGLSATIIRTLKDERLIDDSQAASLTMNAEIYRYARLRSDIGRIENRSERWRARWRMLHSALSSPVALAHWVLSMIFLPLRVISRILHWLVSAVWSPRELQGRIEARSLPALARSGSKDAVA